MLLHIPVCRSCTEPLSLLFPRREPLLGCCRSPSFNIQLKELMNGNDPKPYSEVKSMLAADVARRWAAYAVGCMHVLMHEKNVRFTESIAILIDSEVPEGVHSNSYTSSTRYQC